MSQNASIVLNYSSPDVNGFVPSDGRARSARYAVIIAMAISVLTMAYLAWDIWLTSRMAAGEDPDALFGSNYELVSGLIGIAEIGLLLVAGILVLRWLYRAYANLRPLGHSPRFSPGWAVGYWFIPIINLFRPYQIMKDLWLRSEGKPTAGGYDRARGPTVIAGWWLCWLGSSAVARMATGQASAIGPGDYDKVYTADTTFLIAELLAILAGMQLLAIISHVVSAQALARAEISARGEPPPLAEVVAPAGDTALAE